MHFYWCESDCRREQNVCCAGSSEEMGGRVTDEQTQRYKSLARVLTGIWWSVSLYFIGGPFFLLWWSLSLIHPDSLVVCDSYTLTLWWSLSLKHTVVCV